MLVQTDPRGARGCRVRLALPRLAARSPGAVFLALDRQQGADAAFQRLHQSEPHDMETCYKVFRRDVANRLDLQSKDFGIEPEITCKVARMRARIYEVPISYNGRTYEEGKKIGFKDAVKAAWVLLKYSRWEAPAGDVGAITLRRMAALTPYNRWLHERFERFLGDRILEVGAGVGTRRGSSWTNAAW